jgi:hypothetical protein
VKFKAIFEEIRHLPRRECPAIHVIHGQIRIPNIEMTASNVECNESPHNVSNVVLSLKSSISFVYLLLW